METHFPSIELHIETFYTGRIFFFSTSASFLFFAKTQKYFTNKNNEQLIKQKFLDHVCGSRLDGVEDPFLLLSGFGFESALIGLVGRLRIANKFEQVQTCLDFFKLRLQQERERLQGEPQQQPQEQRRWERQGRQWALVAFLLSKAPMHQ